MVKLLLYQQRLSSIWDTVRYVNWQKNVTWLCRTRNHKFKKQMNQSNYLKSKEYQEQYRDLHKIRIYWLQFNVSSVQFESPLAHTTTNQTRDIWYVISLRRFLCLPSLPPPQLKAILEPSVANIHTNLYIKFIFAVGYLLLFTWHAIYVNINRIEPQWEQIKSNWIVRSW